MNTPKQTTSNRRSPPPAPKKAPSNHGRRNRRCARRLQLCEDEENRLLSSAIQSSEADQNENVARVLEFSMLESNVEQFKKEYEKQLSGKL